VEVFRLQVVFKVLFLVVLIVNLAGWFGELTWFADCYFSGMDHQASLSYPGYH
jgi:hypothetical protein